MIRDGWRVRSEADELKFYPPIRGMIMYYSKEDEMEQVTIVVIGQEYLVEPYTQFTIIEDHAI